jgi:serine O-acetyltransferase
VRAGVAADVVRYLNKSPENQAAGDGLKHRVGALLTPGLLALLAHRTSHYLHLNGWRRLAWLLASANRLLHRVHIPPGSCIGPGCLLPHPAGVTFIGRAGAGLTVYSRAVCCPRTPLEEDAAAGPRLGDRVTVGGHAVVLGPARVGDDSKVAFTVALDRDAPARSLVVSATIHARVGPPEAVAPGARAAAAPAHPALGPAGRATVSDPPHGGP